MEAYCNYGLEPHVTNTVLVNWCPPCTNCIKLSTDDARKKDLSQATGGGQIHDENGSWVIGFHRSLRPMHNLEAEMWALRDGLQLAKSKDLVPICVEINAPAAIHLIMGPNQLHHNLSNFIHDCKCLMRQLGVEKIDHVYRKRKQVHGIVS
ncbi:hypothetical protein RHMOL_Rhmol09G0009500 [Rhododendron molle]|uniref:Uncharacterized protein n=1 Tax=Rhododendron molle TaxID=49168 RepID=A0ACC0M8R9_RHOML|nr:hypothetical protein RHMOL_Rhmol09G0009500 [Rhododendron molle]